MHEEEHERRELSAVCSVVWVSSVDVEDQLSCFLCGCPQLTFWGPAETVARLFQTGTVSARDVCKDPEMFGVGRTRL